MKRRLFFLPGLLLSPALAAVEPRLWTERDRDGARVRWAAESQTADEATEYRLQQTVDFRHWQNVGSKLRLPAGHSGMGSHAPDGPAQAFFSAHATAGFRLHWQRRR